MTTLRTALPVSLAPPLLALPMMFILMWSSGYVVGKLALPFAGPFTLLVLRFGLAALVLLIVAIVTRAPWPRERAQYAHLVVVGLLVQALQFGGLYTGLKLGVSAGVSALIIGSMPLCTAFGAGVFLHERVGVRQWIGLGAGIAGVLLVALGKGVAWHTGAAGIGAVVLALAGITLGTLYQKKYCTGLDLRTGGCIQLAVATAVAFPLALGLEGWQVAWTPTLILASGWLSVVNSIGAVSLLFLMMRRGESSRVASLFYLIPGTTALMGWIVLGERIGLLSICGFAVTAGAVYLCTRTKQP
jgi:drug/metabolite transporter (DMT)-like permease